MRSSPERNDVHQHLASALAGGVIPDDGQRRAAQILDRLNTPVQVVVVGQKGAGKSNLINMLLGKSVLPDGGGMVPVEIAYGPQERTVYLQADGSEKVGEGVDLGSVPPRGTAVIRVELPLRILRHLTLTELDLKGGHRDRKALADWAQNRADIVLWCSQSFDAGEQSLWETASDTLKDHSFLVVTKADDLESQGVLSERISQLSDIVSEEFYRMYPVATLQAIGAGSKPGSRDEDVWVASGGHALANAVRQLVETGRRADRDNALAFLARYAPDMPDIDPREAPAIVSGKRVSRPFVSPPEIDPGTDSGTDPETDSGPDADPAPDTGGTGAGTLRQALEFLEERADLMRGVVDGNRPDKLELVLDHCLETAVGLSEIVMSTEQGDPPFCGIQDDIMECSDMMVLFHLEKSEDAAMDAVTLLLQLKKEMTLAVAA